MEELRLTEKEIAFCEKFAAEHGLAALLDHLGLDGLGNQVAYLTEFALSEGQGWVEGETAGKNHRQTSDPESVNVPDEGTKLQS